MENGENSGQRVDEESSFSIPRGGPIFPPDLVSPLIKPPKFETEVYEKLDILKAELDSCAFNLDDEDISVDELKLRTDEDLVTEAMKIAFEQGDQQEAGTSSDMTGNLCNSGAEDKERSTSASLESSGGLESSDTNLRKRKRRAKQKSKSKKERKCAAAVSKKGKHVDDSYLVKVEHLAKIRQKQEEDKASVELHCFNQTSKANGAISSEKVETLKCVESSSWPVKLKCSRPDRIIPIEYPEVVLCVEIYHHKQTWKKTQEFLVLGCQTLTELRDKIRCLTDVVMEKAVEEEMEKDHPEIFYDSSGYFLIEELFCNDMRGGRSAINYSEPIFDWLKRSKKEALEKWDYILSGVGKDRKVLLDDEPKSGLPNFRTAKMEKTQFRHLDFRLGAGYLYCHQGDCKHIMVIRDMRLIHPDDVQNRAAYPLLVHQPKSVIKKCSVCHIYKATKVTLDDKLAGENPCYFCSNCYQLLHYSKDSQLLYTNFSVFDNLQDY